MSRENLNSDETQTQAVERTLAGFLPRAALVDRDRLMFLAGAAWRESADQRPAANSRLTTAWRRPIWPAATVALAATSLALAIALAIRPEPRVQIVHERGPTPSAPAPESTPAVAQVVAIPVSPAVAAAEPSARRPVRRPAPTLPENNYLQTREVALRLGVDAIGSPQAPASSREASPSYFEWLSDITESPPAASSDARPQSRM